MQKQDYETKPMYQSKRERQAELAAEMAAQQQQYPMNQYGGNAAQARNQMLMRWRDRTRDQLAALSDDPNKAAYLWTNWASRQPTCWAQLSRYKELLVAHRLCSRADVNMIDIEFRELRLSDELEVK